VIPPGVQIDLAIPKPKKQLRRKRRSIGNGENMKVVIAQMKHETHTFIAATTGLSQFNAMGGGEALEGAAAVAASRGRNSAIAAFIDVVEACGGDFEVPVAGEAMPSGPVEDGAFEWMCDRIVGAIEKGCDAVLLDLHGSMVTESFADGEGELLRRIREVAPDLPIGVALDFHCTLTDQIIDHASVITIYRTVPHVDMYETGERAAKTLLDRSQKGHNPIMIARRIPLMASLEKMRPTESPMKDVMDLVRALEEGRNRILNASLSGAHPFTDVFPGGMAVVIIAEDDIEVAEEAAERVLKLAWEKRHDFVLTVEPYLQTLERAKDLPGHPVIMADSGDIAASGGFAADMSVLKAAIRLGFEDLVAGPIHDPVSIRQMVAAGVGSEVTLDIGGKTSAPLLNYVGDPLRISGRVRAIVDGRFKATGPMLRGLSVSIGLMAVLSTETMEILVTEQRVEALDMAVFTHVGIDPREKKYVLLKSRQHYRAAFEPIAKHLVQIAGPGVTNPDFSTFPFQHIERPVFPLEKDTVYRLAKLGTAER
jgi:microcystin degradation protein MlrC